MFAALAELRRLMRPQQSRTDSADLAAIEWPLLERSTIVAAILVSSDGAVLGANARMRQLLGVPTPAALAGRKLKDFLVDRGDWSAWQHVRGAGAAVVLRLCSATGIAVALRGDIRSVKVSGARALCGTFVEAGDDEQLRAAVKQSARMEALGSLTVGIAHDFNNLLTVLVGNLYLVAEELRDRPKAFEKLKSARDAANRGADLIKQLLTFARREEFEVDAIDPRKVVTEIAPLLRRALGSRISLQTELGSEVGRIRASTAQLESVIVNLAINARDAITGKGVVTIAVQRMLVSPSDAANRGLAKGGEYVIASVADNGSGIPDDAIGRVFEPFFSTKRERGGTGLGLSMVRWFAEQAGGAIQLGSIVGQGTTVTLLLPCSTEVAQETVDGTMPLSTLPTGSERVLVLAPDDAVRATIRQILEVLGYAVTFTAGDDEMLAALRAERVELLIVDGPARDDADLMTRAKAIRPELKVIVTTEGALLPSSVPTSAVLAKPFTLADLAGTVRRALDSSADGAATA
jgi:signal transduction histidine kinase/CheY-like chemotaxis protein